MATVEIKNMVCDRCIFTVRMVLSELGYTVNSVSLGKAEIEEKLDQEQLEEVAGQLRDRGFELVRKNNQALIEQIKTTLIDYLDYLQDEKEPVKLSEYLAKQLHHNYSYLSNKFSKATNTTIERYLIQLKIERVKELLSYREMTLSEIAWRLNYSSVQYLSNQFKDVTGMTVTKFKNSDMTSRKSFDAL